MEPIVIWKWSNGIAEAPADESFKLAQALGMATETMWDRTGILEKSGEKVQTLPIAKRMKIKDLGEPNTDGSPGSLIRRATSAVRVPGEERLRWHGPIPRASSQGNKTARTTEMAAVTADLARIVVA